MGPLTALQLYVILVLLMLLGAKAMIANVPEAPDDRLYTSMDCDPTARDRLDPRDTRCSDDDLRTNLDTGVLSIRRAAKLRINEGGRFILFGNGGSLAIASHIATDFALAGWPSIALTDAVALTSHTNDFGPEANFTKQIELLRPRSVDIFVAMSCSGKSANILDAVRTARAALQRSLLRPHILRLRRRQSAAPNGPP